MFRLLLAAALVCVVLSQDSTTTHKPHTGHAHAHTGHAHSPKPSSEPSEHEKFSFHYEATTHQMMVISQQECVIFGLSDSESAAAHSDIGMRTLELKLLGMLGTATRTEVQTTDLTSKEVHACGGHSVAHFYRASAA